MSGYSLHIGLNLVDPASYDGWDGQLSGCVNDAHAMRDLASAAGFQTRIMLDDQATSQAVVGALGELARQATPGDICLVTYSGHGGQVEDVNGDEDDGLDETWVLFDRQVVDDELYQMYSQFAAGVRVVVLSDSCHSGTVAKHVLRTESRKAVLGAARGQGRGATGDVSVVTGPPRSMPYGAERHDNERRRGTYQFVQALSGAKGDADIRAGVLLISGCQDNQLSYDGDVNGQFTGTLLRTWAAGSFTGDYVAFHRRIVDQMPPDQTPNLFTVGAVDPGFTAQRPFTLAAPAATGGSQQGGGQQGGGQPNAGQPSGARPTLRQGAVGDAVVALQQRLTVHGYPVTADGFFGPGTAQAVRGFQQSRGLAADGVVGSMTWQALDAAPVTGGGTGWSGSSGGSSGGGWGGSGGGSGGGSSTGGGWSGNGTSTGGWGSGTTTMTRPTIARGDTGEDVRHLQERLSAHGYSLTPDGIFGPGTESMVKSFQRSNALTADGIVGPRTWDALG